MATQPQPKPKPKPEPEPEPPVPGEDAASLGERLVNVAATSSSGESRMAGFEERLDALFTSHTALTARVEKLEDRVAAPPVGIGRRP